MNAETILMDLPFDVKSMDFFCLLFEMRNSIHICNIFLPFLQLADFRSLDYPSFFSSFLLENRLRENLFLFAINAKRLALFDPDAQAVP